MASNLSLPEINVHGASDIDEEKVEDELVRKKIVWYRNKDQRVIVIMAVLTLVFCAAEFGFGIIANSLALMSDAFHMVSDLISLIVGFMAIQLSRRAASGTKSYGWIRAEVIGGLVNGVFLVAVCFFIILEAIQRFIEPPVISNPMLIIIVGGAGLGLNVVGLIMFASHRSLGHGGHSHGHGGGEGHGHAHGDKKHKHDESKHSHKHKQTSDGGEDGHAHKEEKKKSEGGSNANLHAVFLHMLGDALGSVGAVGSGVIIKYVDHPWKFYADPVLSVLLALIILKSSIPLVKHCSNILLQSVPESLELEKLKRSLLQIDGMVNIHDLHVWQLSDSKHIATLHITVDDTVDFPSVASAIKNIFHKHGVHNTTIQPEYVTGISPNSKVACGMTCEPECAPNLCCETTPLVSKPQKPIQ